MAGLLFVAGIAVSVLCHVAVGWQAAPYTKLEESLLKSYDKKHRPVKDDSTTMQVQVYMVVTHVEQVNEQEQTMKMHGMVWVSWTDEYLTWTPADWNSTRKISIDSWKIWQPALALYNNAKGNGWNLYMYGLPATLSNDGKVWAMGTFSFLVTCLFDFSNYPYDEQECPVVIADWVYDLSRVNLSDPMGNNPWNKPSVRLNYDPMSTTQKKHVAGWEVTDTWRKHCYWGPQGCVEEQPEGQPDWYWSLIEFGINLKRHAPYFGLAVILPTIITSCLTLMVFWIDSDSLSLTLLLFNILLQGIFGWDLVRSLPPGSGSVPKIVSLYGFNLAMTGIAFVLHVAMQYVEDVIPGDTELPFRLTTFTGRLNSTRPFQLRGLNFDPQRLLNEAESEYRDELGLSENTEAPTPTTTAEPEQKGNGTHFGNQLYILRRALFFIFAFMYFVTILACLL